MISLTRSFEVSILDEVDLEQIDINDDNFGVRIRDDKERPGEE